MTDEEIKLFYKFAKLSEHKQRFIISQQLLTITDNTDNFLLKLSLAVGITNLILIASMYRITFSGA